MDSEGNDITEERKVGLLLYRGGTVCYLPNNRAVEADAICKELNFARAEKFNWEDTFDIRFDYDPNLELDSIQCEGPDWESCSYDGRKDYCHYWRSGHSFLLCSGMHYLTIVMLELES